MSNSNCILIFPLFPLGRACATPGALSSLNTEGVHAFSLLFRHVSGDWGDLDEVDIASNDAAVANGGRLFSSYTLPSGSSVWVITEADRSLTTILLPKEY